ncbi:hypothetical protein BOSP111201_10530 [Bordetella sputigena]|uniref:hypothetical protein n=1 Tax=Bordetella sputigena TaxID=1416810 RepID=UPI0039EDE9FE
MPFATTDADVYIRILIDDLVVSPGQTTGVYWVDSSQARVSRGSVICWKLELVNPKSPGIATFVEIGDCSAWGATGTPQLASDNTDNTAYVGSATTAGTYTYDVSFDVIASTGNPSTIKVTPTINVT